MNVIEFQPERRRRRSTNTYEAIRLQLTHIFKKEDLRNFVLGDSRGLLMAHAGHSQESEVLAAYAPLLARSTDRVRREKIFERLRAFVPDATPDSVYIRTFSINGEVLHLCVLGNDGVNHNDLYRATTGIRRIVDQTEAVA